MDIPSHVPVELEKGDKEDNGGRQVDAHRFSRSEDLGRRVTKRRQVAAYIFSRSRDRTNASLREG